MKKYFSSQARFTKGERQQRVGKKTNTEVNPKENTVKSYQSPTSMSTFELPSLKLETPRTVE